MQGTNSMIKEVKKRDNIEVLGKDVRSKYGNLSVKEKENKRKYQKNRYRFMLEDKKGKRKQNQRYYYASKKIRK